MKKLILIVAVCFSLIVVGGTSTAYAQKDQKLSATPKAFQLFYAKFSSAAAKKDKNAIAALTYFPFEYGWDAGDEGTYSKAQFLKRFSDIFADTGKLFKQKDPTFYVEKGSYNMTNEADASHYAFEKKGGVYKFTAFMVEP